jgi:hypothetical protein
MRMTGRMGKGGKQPMRLTACTRGDFETMTYAMAYWKEFTPFRGPGRAGPETASHDRSFDPARAGIAPVP